MEPTEQELANLRRLAEMARQEDVGGGDVTGVIVPVDARAGGDFVAQEEMVFCGGALLGQIAACYDANILTELAAGDGQRVSPGTVLARWSGPARAILAAERVALNFLQHLSAIATITSRYVHAVAGSSAEIYDTRKTTPGWRSLEKYAVRVGGGRNHRMGLYDAVMVKDNHLAVLARSGGDPLAALAEVIGGVGEVAFVELEVDSPDQFATAVTLPVDVILLDNMSADDMLRAVRMRDQAGRAEDLALEASGGITLENVRAVAGCGVDRISVGALTHSAGSVDIAFDMER